MISSADKETEIEILHRASMWSADKEGTKKTQHNPWVAKFIF